MYASEMKNARRNPYPYRVKQVNLTFFKDYTGLKYYPDYRPGCKKGDPTITMTVAYKYSPDRSVYYKLRHTDEWIILPKRAVKEPKLRIRPLHEGTLSLDACKLSDLLGQLDVLPRDTHAFYKSIKVK